MILKNITNCRTLWSQRGLLTLFGMGALGLSISVVATTTVWAQGKIVDEVAVAVPSDHIHGLTYSADGKQLAGGSWDTTVKIWDADTGELQWSLEGHKGTVRTISFASHSSLLASGSDDGTVIVWDAKTGERVRTLEDVGPRLFALKFCADGTTLWTGSKDLSAWDIETGKIVSTVKLNVLIVWSIDISPDGKALVVTSLNQDNTQSARIFDLQSGKLLRSFGGKRFGVYRACFLSDGKHLAGTAYSQTDGPSLRIWDIETGEMQEGYVPESNEIWAISLSPNGKHVATGGEGPVVDMDFPPETIIVPPKNAGEEPVTVTFIPRGQRLLSAFSIWDLKTGERRIAQNGSLARITSLCFSPDSKRLAYCDSASVRVIDVDSGEEVWSGKYGRH